MYQYNINKNITEDNFFTYFNISEFSIDHLHMNKEISNNDKWKSIKCSHQSLNNLIGQNVSHLLST